VGAPFAHVSLLRKKYMKYIGTCLLTLAFLSSLACSRDTVDSDKVAPVPTTQQWDAPTSASSQTATSSGIDRSYLLTGSEDGSMSFVASFRVKGSFSKTVKLVAPSSLTVNGQAVSDSQLISKNAATTAGALLPILSPFFWLASGTNYYLNLVGANPNQAVLVEWIDPSSQVFTDSLTVPSGGSISPPFSMSPGQAATINISGGGTGDYSASLSQDEMDAGQQIILASSNSGQPVTFSAEDMGKLKNGPATLTIERNVKISLDQRGGNHGSGSATFKFLPVIVNLN
jgi:hypothetical protein